MKGLASSLAEVSGVCAVVAAIGWGGAAFLVPRGRPWRPERLAWGFGLGLALSALSVPLAFTFRLAPGWIPLLLLAAAAIVPARLLRPRDPVAADAPMESARAATLALAAALVAGGALYALRALTEPMWANDYLAIWGFKGKTIFAEQQVPHRLFLWTSLSFSHPEYPLGLPFLYAGVAFLLGRWDDHAMALLFPLLQIATLLALYGWLRRRGATRIVALGAAALLSHFEPLYRGFTTGMAEVPLSFALLLLGTSLSDRLDRTDRAASRRLALASVLCVATKNEGLFFVAAGFLLAALYALSRRGFAARAAAVLALPAAIVVAAHRIVRGSLPLRDFDFSLLRRPSELPARLVESVATAIRETPATAWAALACLLLLVAAGRSVPAGDRLLVLASLGVAAYLVLPAFAVEGPAWLVHTAFARTVAALAPLVAAGVAVRISVPGGSSECAPDRAASGASPAPRTPSTPGS